jgi:hydroxymethylpyrimidine pyrophosphatase-like HAD family hydrolase
LTKENVVACGDGYNDLSMIQFAGLGVAMGNAQNGVLEAADFITLSNDEDGVAYVINNYIFHRNKLRRMFNRDYWKLKWQNKKRKK